MPIESSEPVNKNEKKKFKKVIRYYCLREIYRHGRSFGESGRKLIESKEENLFVPGMINICLSAEILLKSINASMVCLEDELEVDGQIMYQGREETLVLTPSGRGHRLSDLFENLPSAIQKEISEIAAIEGYKGSIRDGLTEYDDTFVNWRYIYENRAADSLATHPLFVIVNAIDVYCQKNVGIVIESRADEVPSLN